MQRKRNDDDATCATSHSHQSAGRRFARDAEIRMPARIRNTIRADGVGRWRTSYSSSALSAFWTKSAFKSGMSVPIITACRGVS
eukprot:1195575-Prorocentrum_minimum.AAC.4